MHSRLAPIVLLAAAFLIGAKPIHAGELLRVGGESVRWAPSATGTATVITYAVVTESYSLPSDRQRLSPDNCGVMSPFADIVSASAAVSVNTAKQQLRSALAAWEAVADVRFVEVTELSGANIIVGATDTSTGQAYANLSISGKHGSQPVAKALGAARDGRSVDLAARVKDKTDRLIEQAYVCLNSKKRWKAGFDGNLEVYDLRYTFMHEIGHAIGLDHPGSTGSIMAYRYDERVRQLQSSDIEAAQSLYGARK